MTEAISIRPTYLMSAEQINSAAAVRLKEHFLFVQVPSAVSRPTGIQAAIHAR